MEMPMKYQTSQVPLLTAQNIAHYLNYSRMYIYNKIADGTLVPQRLTVDGRFLFEPEYWEWAQTHVPFVVKRLSELRVE